MKIISLIDLCELGRIKLWRYYITAIIFTFYFSHLEASEVDSLKQLSYTLSDSAKVDVLNQISWELKSSNAHEAINYASKALDQSRLISYKKGQVEALFNLSVIHSIKSNFKLSDSLSFAAISLFRSTQNLVGIAKSWNVLGLNHIARGNYQEASEYLKKSLAIFKEVNYIEYILKVEGNLANINYQLGHFDSALISYQNLIRYAKEKADVEMLADNLKNQGLVYAELGKYAQSLETFFEVLEISNQLEDSNRIGGVLNSISTVFNQLDMADESIETIRRAIRINEKLKNNRRLADNFNSIANAFRKIDQFDSAFIYYQKAIKKNEYIQNNNRGLVYTNIGIYYMHLNKIDSAEHYLKRALKINTLSNQEDDIARDKLNLAEIYQINGENDSALNLLLESYEYWVRLKMYKQIALTAEKLSILYSKYGNQKMAFDYQLEVKRAQDSIFSREKQNELMRVLIKQRLKEQSDFTVLKDHNSKNNKSMYLSMLLISAIGILLLVIMWHKRKNTVIELKNNLDKKERELTFQSLSSIQKDQFIQQFTKNIEDVTRKNPENQSMLSLLQDAKIQSIGMESWDNFKSTFEQIAPNFFEALLQKHPTLTNKELRLCAMMRLNIPTEEMAKILGISSKSVNMAKYRLRKHLNVSGKRSLEKFIFSIKI